MTNTAQTEPLSLLDGVEPDWYGNANSLKYHKTALVSTFETVGASGLYSRETVEALLEANRKQVLLEAAERFESMEWVQSVDPNENYAEATELRRMALEPAGVDKGEKDETQG
jgi:hypothetical protein